MDAELRAAFDRLWSDLAAATTRRTPLTLGHLGTIGLDGSPHVPGTPLPGDRADRTDASGAGPAHAQGEAGPAGEAAEFARFAWVRLDVDAVDRLDLSALPHVRQHFRRVAGGWTGSAVVP